MWIARNKNGELRIFEEPPKRYHEGPMLDSNLVGFNDAVSVGNDEYSFWAVQEFYQSNRIDDRKHYGIRIMTEGMENGKKVWYPYVPECAKELTWEDEPIEIEIKNKTVMNANELPEKYKTCDWLWNYGSIGLAKEHIKRLNNAIIEKACEYFRTKKKCVFACIGEDLYKSLLDEREIEDFKIYMKGE